MSLNILSNLQNITAQNKYKLQDVRKKNVRQSNTLTPNNSCLMDRESVNIMCDAKKKLKLKQTASFFCYEHFNAGTVLTRFH